MEELDLKELLQIFWEKKIQIILIVAIFAVIGVIYSTCFVVPKYEAATTLLLATNSSPNKAGTATGTATGTEITTTDVTLNSKLVSTYSVLVKSDTAIRTVISNLGIDTSEESIKKNVSVTAKADTEVIEIKVRNEDPVTAAKIANEIASVFIGNIKEFYGIENVHVVDKAEIEETPYNVNNIKNIIIFAFVGVVVSAMYVLLANMLDTTIKSSTDIEKISGLAVLASIPIYDMNETKGKNKKGGRR